MKHHALRTTTTKAASGSVECPIRPPHVIFRRETEGPGNTVDRPRSTFELEEDADRCFIKIHLKAGKAEGGAVFFVAEAGTKAQRTENGRPGSRVLNDQFPFEPSLIPRPSGASAQKNRVGPSRGLRCQNRTTRSTRICGRGRGSLGAEAQQTPPAPKIRRGGVVERVLL